MINRMCRPNGFYWLRSVERKDGQRIYHFYRIGDALIWIFSLLFSLLILGFCPALFAGVRFPVVLFAVILCIIAVLLFFVRRLIRNCRSR